MADPAAPRFGSFLRAAGKLAAARQLAALVFVGAVLALPLLTSGLWVTEFVWAYFVVLALTSVLGFGFERLAGSLAVDGDDAPVGALVLVRLLSVPFVALGQWALLAFVGVSLSPLAWLATLAWTVAALLGPIAFGALRTRNDSTTEPIVVFVTRVTQFVVLVAAAASGANVAVALVLVASCEAIGVLVAFRSVGPPASSGMSFAALARVPWRQAAALAAVEVVALAYLRADLLLVGRVLGPAAGAAYGMLYRVIDGLNGTVGSAGLWLYAETVSDRDVEGDDGLRARALRLLPRVAIVIGVVMVVGAELVGRMFTDLAKDTATLELLVAAFPLLTVNTIELHVRSAQGHNRAVVGIGLSALAVNVAVCFLLIPPLGMQGAALALIASEVLQSVLLFAGAQQPERAGLGRSMGIAAAGAAGLLVLGFAVQGSVAAAATLGVCACAGVVLVARRVARGDPIRPMALLKTR